MLKLSASLLFLMLMAQGIQGQSYSVKAYNPSNGLNQSQVGSIFQDTRGFYWIASREGVSRFDGVEFQNFYKSDGLVDNRVSRILEKKDGTLIVVSQNGYSVLMGEKFHPYRLVPDGHSHAINFSAIDEHDCLWLGISTPGEKRILMIREDSLVTRSDILVLPDGSKANIKAYDRSTGSIILQASDRTFWTWKDEHYARLNGLNDGTVTLSFNQNPVFRDANGYYLLREKGFEKLEPSEEVSMLHDSVLFAYARNDSIYLMNHFQYCRIPFRAKFVFSLFMDRDRTLWACSEEGLFKILSYSFRNFTREEEGMEKNIWSMVEDTAGQLWFGSLTGSLQVWDGMKLRSVDDFKKSNARSFYMGSCCLYDGKILFPTGNTVLQYDRGEFRALPFIKGQTEKIYQSPVDSSVFIGSVSQGLFVLRGDERSLISELNYRGVGWVTDMVWDPEGFYWIVTSNTIAKLVGDSLHILDSQKVALKSGYVVEVDSGGNAWFGGQEGLFWYDRSGDLFRKVPLHGNMQTVNGLALMDEGKLLAGRMKDLVEVDTRKYFSGDAPHSKHYNSNNGFLGYEVQQDGVLRDREGNFWISCIDRVVRFTPGMNEAALQAPQLNILKIETMDESRHWVEYCNDLEFTTENVCRVKLRHDQNTLQIHYRGISGYAPSQVQYRFRLMQSDREWSAPSYDNKVILSDLRPGQYSFQVMAGSIHDLWSDPVVLSIAVVPAFWQTRVFQFAAIIIFTLLVVLTVLWIVKRQQKRKELERTLKKEMFDSRIKELIRHFDPHFTFNVLNVLSLFILNGKKEIAHENLVRFSVLLRKSLSGYGKILIPLQDEIEFIREYCALQSTLLGERLSYSISGLADGMDRLQVPRMIIHSFVENSVKHAVKPRKSGGEISLSFETSAQYLVIRITDRAKDPSEVIREKTSGTGLGHELSQNIFEMLSSYYKKRFSFEINELWQDDISIGTTVVAQIPILYENGALN